MAQGTKSPSLVIRTDILKTTEPGQVSVTASYRDSDNKPLKDKTIRFFHEGDVKSKSTDQFGYASVTFDKLEARRHIFSIETDYMARNFAQPVEIGKIAGKPPDKIEAHASFQPDGKVLVVLEVSSDKAPFPGAVIRVLDPTTGSCDLDPTDVHGSTTHQFQAAPQAYDRKKIDPKLSRPGTRLNPRPVARGPRIVTYTVLGIPELETSLIVPA